MLTMCIFYNFISLKGEDADLLNFNESSDEDDKRDVVHFDFNISYIKTMLEYYALNKKKYQELLTKIFDYTSWYSFYF